MLCYNLFQPVLHLAVKTLVLSADNRSHAIAEWGRDYGQQVVVALGFANGRMPVASTLR